MELRSKVGISLLLSCLIALLALLVGMKDDRLSTFLSSPKVETLATSYAQECPKAAYSTQIFSFNPLIIYIRDFISPAEREHLKTLA